MKTVNINKISAIFLGVVLLTSVLSSVAYAGGVPINPIVNKTSTQTAALPGGEWDYTLGVLNDGTVTLDFAVLGDPLDSNLEFVSVVNDSDCFYDDIEHEVVCFIIALATGEEFTTDVTVRVLPSTPSGTEIPNTAHVFVDEDDIPEDSSDPIFLLISDEEEDDCTCESISIRPRLQNEGKKNEKPVIKIESLYDNRGATGTKLKILITMPWTASITCSGNKGGCIGNFIVKANPFDTFTTGLPGNPQTATIVDGDGFVEIIQRNKKFGVDKTPSQIECEGDCAETPVPRRILTSYEILIENTSPQNKDTRPQITGTIHLAIEPDLQTAPCKNASGWEMTLVIKSSAGKKRGPNGMGSIIDEKKSDYDGDGMTNEQEGFGDKDTTNDDVNPKNGTLDYLEKLPPSFLFPAP